MWWDTYIRIIKRFVSSNSKYRQFYIWQLHTYYFIFLFRWTKSLLYQYFNINIQFFVSDISFHCLLFESITRRGTCNSKKVMKKIATNTMFTIGYTENQGIISVIYNSALNVSFGIWEQIYSITINKLVMCIVYCWPPLDIRLKKCIKVGSMPCKYCAGL